MLNTHLNKSWGVYFCRVFTPILILLISSLCLRLALLSEQLLLCSCSPPHLLFHCYQIIIISLKQGPHTWKPATDCEGSNVRIFIMSTRKAFTSTEEYVPSQQPMKSSSKRTELNDKGHSVILRREIVFFKARKDGKLLLPSL